MKTVLKIYLALLLLCLVVSPSFAQVFSNKVVGKKNEATVDSLKSAEYPYLLPIWGDKVTKAGYKLPLPAGISVQYFWQESDLIIENLQVGFNNGEMYNLDGIVRFDNSVATASALTVRPDVWLFPFLDVYAILGTSTASTQVNFGLWLPDSTGNIREVGSAGTVVDFTTTTFGFGLTPTIGVGGGFLALDMNIAWTDVPQLSQPARSFVFGPRFGKNFQLKDEQAFAVWAGGFRVSLNSGTEGSLNLSEVFPTDQWGANIENGYENINSASQEIEAWWNTLTPVEQMNPINEAKYNRANEMLSTASSIVTAADAAVSNLESSSVQYSMDKRPKDAWNFIVGGQYQLNRHLMFRGEFGFLGSRTQFMGGLQYRFGL
jgi:hypothetical protein